MIRKLLITTILFFSFLTFVNAGDYVVGIHGTNVDGFINIDSTSTVDINPAINETGLYSDIIVRILDRNNNPIVNHNITLYAQGNPSEVSFIQPSLSSDSDGYVVGKVKATSQGTYTIKAVDTTLSQNIDIVDSSTFTVFPVPSPTLLSEPHYTQGVANRVFLSPPAGLSTYNYYFEISKTSSFENIIANSGWVATSSFEFTNLSNNILYYYRVKAKNVGGGESGWSNTVFSTQDSQPSSIKFVELQPLLSNGVMSGITLRFDAWDNFEIAEVLVECTLKSGLKKDCGVIENSGTRYYVNIPLSDLEKTFFGNLYEKYNFCVVTKDKAGNSNINCDFNIEITKYIDIPLPIFTNIVNSIIKYINDGFTDVSNQLNGMVIDSNEVVLQLSSILVFVLVALISLSILAQGLFVVPTYIFFQLIRTLRTIGFVKNGPVLGFVYDSITGKPVRYARVEIFDGQNNLVHKSVTDKRGNFNGNIDIGKYRVLVSHAHYLYPSELYKEYDTQYKNGKLYRGEYIIVAKRNPMNLLIPIDPMDIYAHSDRNKMVEKRIIGLMKSVTFLLLTLGLAISVMTLERFPNALNIVLLLMYIPVFGIFLKSIIRLKI